MSTVLLAHNSLFFLGLGNILSTIKLRCLIEILFSNPNLYNKRGLIQTRDQKLNYKSTENYIENFSARREREYFLLGNCFKNLWLPLYPRYFPVLRKCGEIDPRSVVFL